MYQTRIEIMIILRTLLQRPSRDVEMNDLCNESEQGGYAIWHVRTVGSAAKNKISFFDVPWVLT